MINFDIIVSCDQKDIQNQIYQRLYYLISILVEVRKAFGKFLKRYPYCFVYWSKWSEIEKRHGEYDEALEVLKRGLVAMEYLSIDIWIAYLELYHKLFNDHDEFDTGINIFHKNQNFSGIHSKILKLFQI